MLTDIISDVKSRLAQAGVRNVFTAFDALPVDKKGECFTVVGVSSLSVEAPIKAPMTVYFPIRAEVEITLLAPESWSLEQIYGLFCEKIEPVLLELSGLTTRLKSLSLRPDSNLHRTVLKAVVFAGGIRTVERSSL
ncbi:MAG: hypothetical protein IJ071_00015 [Ruminococcus sp.]|nr:hypothetical protein [Ruminococcus sp.]